MTKIVYDFETIKGALETLKTKSNDIDTVITDVNKFSTEVSEVLSALNLAKAKTVKNLDAIKSVLDECSNKYLNLCTDYQTFETKKLSDSVFSMNFNVELVDAPNGVSDSEQVASSNSTSDTIKVESVHNNTQGEEKVIQYKIKKGDSLSKIAKAYNTTVESIVAANSNKIKDIDIIYAGDTLIIPTVLTGAGALVSGNATKEYKKEDVAISNNVDVSYSENDDLSLGNYRITSYYPGDGCSSGTRTGSGKTVKDFQTTNIDGKRVYTYKGKLVVAAATEELLKDPSFNFQRYEGKHYFKYNDTLTVNINGNKYEAIVLDSCGASMKQNKNIIDFYVPSSSDIIDINNINITI